MKSVQYDIGPVRWFAQKGVSFIWPNVHVSRFTGVRMVDAPAPELPGPAWVRLRTVLGGVCGTDVAAITLRNHPAGYLRNVASWPMWLGHENVSIIDETGPGVTGWRKGDRVVVEPALSCVPRGIEPVCRMCAEGRFGLCERTFEGAVPAGSLIGYNNFTGGTWGEYFIAHESQLHRVPANMSDRDAVLVDPVACALHGALKHRPADDDRVLVFGGGMLGVGVVASLRAMGCRAHVTVLVRHDHQAAAAKAYCADATLRTHRKETQRELFDRVAALVGGRRVPGKFGNQGLIGGFDVVYDCVGTGESMSQAMKFTRSGGVVVSLGTSQITLVDTTKLWFGELTLLGCSGRQVESFEGDTLHTYDVLFKLFEAGRFKLDGFTTETFPLQQFRDALRAVGGKPRKPIFRAILEP